MKISLPDEPGGLITALYGDEYGVGTICYVSFWAFIAEDERKDVDHWFWPEMKWAIREKIGREQGRWVFFCSNRFLDKLEPLSHKLFQLKNWFLRRS